MAARTVNEIMDALGVSLSTVSGLRVFDFPPDSAQPPFAFVDFPTVTYDLTYGRACDRFVFNVYVGVGTRRDRVTRDVLSNYVAGGSIKAAIEATVLAGASFRVMSAEYLTIGLAGGEYPGVMFTVDVAA